MRIITHAPPLTAERKEPETQHSDCEYRRNRVPILNYGTNLFFKQGACSITRENAVAVRRTLQEQKTSLKSVDIDGVVHGIPGTVGCPFDWEESNKWAIFSSKKTSLKSVGT
jgi:hypothetical protein